MTEPAKCVKFARRLLLLLAMLGATNFFFVPAMADGGTGHEPVRTVNTAAEPGAKEPMTFSAPKMNSAERTGVFLTWGIVGVALFLAVLALVVFIFKKARGGGADDEDDVDAPSVDAAQANIDPAQPAAATEPAATGGEAGKVSEPSGSDSAADEPKAVTASEAAPESSAPDAETKPESKPESKPETTSESTPE